MEAVMECLSTPRTFDMEALKQPRGFLRCLQWFFAMLAFSTCADFSTKIGFDIVCTENTLQGASVTTSVHYPFRLDHYTPDQGLFGDKLPCGISVSNKTYEISFPGDFSSDAEFFVFTGVITWLYCFVSLAIYVFYSTLYADEQKNYPKVDFIISTLLAMFWLAGSSAWANGLSGLKSACDPDTWIFNSPHNSAICFKTQEEFYKFTQVEECKTTSSGSFGGANVSVVLGFLNFFLWTCNLWFLYKETKWYKGGDQVLTPSTIENPIPNP